MSRTIFKEMLSKLQQEKTLSTDEIASLVTHYKETGDWSVFDDVPPSQYKDITAMLEESDYQLRRVKNER